MTVEEVSTDKVLPAGLTLRAWAGTPDTARLAELMAGVSNAANRADGIDQLVVPAELANWLSSPGEHFDPADDVVLAESESTLIGYGWVEWVDTTDGLRAYQVSGYVHPDRQRRGIGRAILDWEEARAISHATASPTDKPLVLASWSPERRVAKQALLTGAGYEVVRWFFDMRRPTLDDIEVPPMPEGLEVRPIGHDRASLRRLFDADAEAFQDHWGGFAADDAEFQMWVGEPTFDPSLFVVAWDGDEMAGAVINAIYAEDNAAFDRRRGWLDSVFVRRPWRRRGLAGALVARSLVVLRERGMNEAMLGVDSDNPTGALGVYERAGFVVHRRGMAFRKPMEVAPGG